jgi:hypothetical protein
MSDALLYSKILLNCPSHERPPSYQTRCQMLCYIVKYY